MLPVLFPFLWIGGWLIASIVYRWMNGKPIIPRTPADASFHENWCSGRSLRNWYTRMGGARNCLKVYVQGRELVVTPHFPFTLAFLPEIYGLDVRVPLTAITGIERAESLFGRSVRLEFSEAFPPAMELRLHDEDGLIRNLSPTAIANRDSPPPKPRKSWRLTFFRIFAAIWGAGVLIGAFEGLPEDYRFRRDGIEVTGIVDGFDNPGGGKRRAILSYSVGDQRYHLSPVFGSDKIGESGRLFYLPTDPAEARDADFLAFDLGALVLGLLALTASLFGGRIARRLS